MLFHCKTGLAGQLLFQLVEVAIAEIHHLAAIGADEVVMVLLRPAQQVAAAIAAGVHLTYQADVGQHLQGAVDGDQAYVRALLPGTLVKLGRGEVILGIGDGFKHRAALGGDLITPLLYRG